MYLMHRNKLELPNPSQDCNPHIQILIYLTSSLNTATILQELDLFLQVKIILIKDNILQIIPKP